MASFYFERSIPMNTRTRRILRMVLMLAAIAAVLCAAAGAVGSAAQRPMVDCPDCQGYGICMTCYGTDPACEACGGSNVCPTCGGTGQVAAASNYYSSFWALVPPIIAIALALITKEVYSSLFIGVVACGLFYCGFHISALDTILND